MTIISYGKPADKARFFIKFECKRRLRILSFGITYSIRDLICDVINYCALNFDMGKINI